MEIDGRLTMRTIADALAVFDQHGGLDDRAEILAPTVELPDGSRINQVFVVGEASGSRLVVTLPSARHFNAKNTYGERCRHDASKIDGAVVDGDGNMQLRDGTYFHHVELEAEKFPRDFTAREEKILVDALRALNVLDKCLSEIRPDHLTTVLFLDFGLVKKVGSETRISSLKRTAGQCGVSRQELASVLARAGFRIARNATRCVKSA